VSMLYVQNIASPSLSRDGEKRGNKTNKQINKTTIQWH